MDISSLINRVARGKHGSEHLTREEACELFTQLLSPSCDDLQLGAFLIAERMKGETSAELAGFIEASRRDMEGFGTFKALSGAVDLPCYAGKRRAPHSYLGAAVKAKDEGIPLVIHGVASIQGRVTAWQLLKMVGVRRAASLQEAAAILAGEGIVYTDIADICPNLSRIYQLRTRLGVRSFANSVARLLNPLQCDGQINGFFHTPYADYMAQANVQLEQPRSLIFMGAEGEPELYADRQKLIVRQQGEEILRLAFPAAGLPVYPRQPMDLEMLLHQGRALITGDTPESAREEAVIGRMLQAFRWASSGVLPCDWEVLA